MKILFRQFVLSLMAGIKTEPDFRNTTLSKKSVSDSKKTFGIKNLIIETPTTESLATKTNREKTAHRGFVGSGKCNQSFQLWLHIVNMPPL